MTFESYPLRLYVRNTQTSAIVLEPAPDGIPEVVRPAPSLVRATYVTPPINDDMLGVAYADINKPTANLVQFGASPDGPPLRSALVFTYEGTERISYRDGPHNEHGKEATVYLASTQASSHQWTSDAAFKQEGYFLAGIANTVNLWRVGRLEFDLANRCVFTVAPVELAHGLPRATFAAVADAVLRQEAETHWREVQEALARHSYYPLVTAAKNLAETLAFHHLAQAGVSMPRNLAPMIEKLEELGDASPYSKLDYHLLHKLRMLHAWTHPDRVARIGRAVPPRLALSSVEDLVELLTSLGFVED